MKITSKLNNKECSPCIRNCCLDENDVCVGCYRTLVEIVGWREKSESQRKGILARCEQRKIKLLLD